MRYLLGLLFRLVPVLVVVAVVRALAAVLTPWSALAAAAGIGFASAVVGAVLLRTSEVGRVTWRNYLGGWLLPWGYVLGRGRLRGIVLVTTLVWIGLAAAVVCSGTVAPAGAPPVPPAPAPAPSNPWLLLVAWIVDGACLVFALGLLANTSRPSSSGRSLMKLCALLVGLMVGSGILHGMGQTSLATLVAGGPPLLIGVCYGGFLVTILVIGRNARWN